MVHPDDNVFYALEKLAMSESEYIYPEDNMHDAMEKIARLPFLQSLITSGRNLAKPVTKLVKDPKTGLKMKTFGGKGLKDWAKFRGGQAMQWAGANPVKAGAGLAGAAYLAAKD